MIADIYRILTMLIAGSTLPERTRNELIDAVKELKEQDALGTNARLARTEIKNVRSTDV